MKKTILIGSIAISVLILLSSLPSVFASQTYQPLKITPEIKEQLAIKFKDITNNYPLEWSPGLILQIFFKVVELYIDYIVENGWIPGLTFAMIYLFIVLVILGLAFNNPE